MRRILLPNLSTMRTATKVEVTCTTLTREACVEVQKDEDKFSKKY